MKRNGVNFYGGWFNWKRNLCGLYFILGYNVKDIVILYRNFF